jgi:epoxide hydrolase
VHVTVPIMGGAPLRHDAAGGTIKPFTSHVPDRVLLDLRRRLSETRWPDLLPGTTWEYGADVGTVSLLAHYWQNGYDWRAAEAHINQFAQFTTEIDDQTIHFIHERSPRPDATPLMLIHGWPGSIVEFLALIKPLTHPKHPSTPAFDVTIPSLPGFGFSGPTKSRGWDTLRMAKAFIVLMERLGYAKFGVQGGDWGSVIAQQMAHEAPAHVIGIHANVDAQYWDAKRSSFYSLQADEPQTAAYALTDSPVGWLAWLAVKFQDLADHDGDFLHAVDRDTFLTGVTLYWVTGTVGSSMRIYREHQLSGGDSTLPRITTPVGHAVFPKEAFASPVRRIGHSDNVVQRNEMPRGGHFAALEQPDLLLDDIRLFFAKVNGGNQ